MTTLEHYGWNAFFQPEHKTDLIIGRITSIQGFKYYVITNIGEKEAELAGKLRHAASTEELPKLGDWVTLKEYDTLGYIIDVLPRKNELARKTAGRRADRQLLAVNIAAA
jgi:ribosome biogenesis GTPase